MEYPRKLSYCITVFNPREISQVASDSPNPMSIVTSELICNPDEQTLASVARDLSSMNRSNQEIVLKKKGRRAVADYFTRSNFDEIDKIPSTSSLF